MTWTLAMLQQQTEMLPALAQVCSRCPHVQHLLVLVDRGAPLPRAMFVTYENIRRSVEAMALQHPGLAPYVPWEFDEDALTCAPLIRASEQLRDAERFYLGWMETQARPVKVLAQEMRGGDLVLVPREDGLPALADGSIDWSRIEMPSGEGYQVPPPPLKHPADHYLRRGAHPPQEGPAFYFERSR